MVKNQALQQGIKADLKWLLALNLKKMRKGDNQGIWVSSNLKKSAGKGMSA